MNHMCVNENNKNDIDVEFQIVISALCRSSIIDALASWSSIKLLALDSFLTSERKSSFFGIEFSFGLFKSEAEADTS